MSSKLMMKLLILKLISILIQLLTDHCFVNSLKCFNINPDIIEFAKDIIRDVLPLQHLNKICSTFGIIWNVSYGDNEGKQHSPEQYGLKPPCRNFSMDLILIFEHHMPNISVDKSINVITNRTMKLSTLISALIKND
jgi:hypothetical protein